MAASQVGSRAHEYPMADPIERPRFECCRLLNLLRNLNTGEGDFDPGLPPEVILRELEEELEALSRLEEALQLSPCADVCCMTERNGR